jgi:hypothetical protein
MYKVIDNFLPVLAFKDLQTSLLSAEFPWYLNKTKVSPDHNTNDVYDFQFTHTFYTNFFPTSSLIGVLNPLLESLDPSAILRIKANLTTPTPKIIEYGMHTDYGVTDGKFFTGKTAVFYVNTNDGLTIFEDGSKVESVENRIVIFDSNIKHTGTSCTDSRYRVVLNINFFEWEFNNG